jgi:hypothetical protein
MHERSVAQPFQQLNSVGGLEDIVKGVVAVKLKISLAYGEQMQIVVTQDIDNRLAETFQKAQDRQRLGAAVDNISYQPESVSPRVEFDQF